VLAHSRGGGDLTGLSRGTGGRRTKGGGCSNSRRYGRLRQFARKEKRFAPGWKEGGKGWRQKWTMMGS